MPFAAVILLHAKAFTIHWVLVFFHIFFYVYIPINAYIIIEPHAFSCSQCCVYKNKSLPFAVVRQFNRHGIRNER